VAFRFLEPKKPSRWQSGSKSPMSAKKEVAEMQELLTDLGKTKAP
jgi:hypothetical protein